MNVSPKFFRFSFLTIALIIILMGIMFAESGSTEITPQPQTLSPTVTDTPVSSMATPAPTSTSTPTPTPSPSPRPTSTFTPSPTATPKPTNTPTPTDTPTSTPVPTDTPIPSPTAIPTNTPSPIPTLVSAPPMLIAPIDQASSYNRLDLEWDWPGILGQNDYFQVQIWNRYNVCCSFSDDTAFANDVEPIDVAWVKKNFYSYDQIDEEYDREYKWRITVVRGTPGTAKDWSTAEVPVWNPGTIEWMSQPSEIRTLYVEPGKEPPPSSKENNDGDGPGKCESGDRSC